MTWILLFGLSLATYAHAGESYAFKLKRDLTGEQIETVLSGVTEIAKSFGTGAVTLQNPKRTGLIELSEEGAEKLRALPGIHLVEKNDFYYINADANSSDETVTSRGGVANLRASDADRLTRVEGIVSVSELRPQSSADGSSCDESLTGRIRRLMGQLRASFVPTR